jgi:hypothetical protein
MHSVNCPFAHGNIVEACGIDGAGRIMQQILNGTLTNMEHLRLIENYTDSKPELTAVMKALARPRNANGGVINEFDRDYEVKEFRATFRKTRESTACDPSGLNMSYWKACAENDDLARVQSFFIEKAF